MYLLGPSMGYSEEHGHVTQMGELIAAFVEDDEETDGKQSRRLEGHDSRRLWCCRMLCQQSRPINWQRKESIPRLQLYTSRQLYWQVHVSRCSEPQRRSAHHLLSIAAERSMSPRRIVWWTSNTMPLTTTPVLHYSAQRKLESRSMSITR